MGRPRRSAASKAVMKTKAMLSDPDGGVANALDLESLIKGKTVRKVFPGHGVFEGKVQNVRTQGKKKIFIHVKYKDGDEEDLDVSEFVISCDDRALRERVRSFAIEKGLMVEKKKSRKKSTSPIPKKKNLNEDFVLESEEDDFENGCASSKDEESQNFAIQPGLTRSGSVRTPMEIDYCALTEFRGRSRRIAPKNRPELPNRSRSCTSVGSEHLGDAAMIWCAIHTFNTSPQIKDKDIKAMFPILVISAFGFQDFLDSLANVGTPPSMLIHEIHMALLHPLLRQHVTNQISSLKKNKESEATVPKWIISSYEHAVKVQDVALRLDRIRWPAVLATMLQQYASGEDERELASVMISKNYEDIDIETRIRLLQWLLGQVMNLHHVVEAISTSLAYVKSKHRESKEKRKQGRTYGVKSLEEEQMEEEYADRLKRMPPNAIGKSQYRYWTSDAFNVLIDEKENQHVPRIESCVFVEDGLTGHWYVYTSEDMKVLRNFIKNEEKRQNRRRLKWWQTEPEGLRYICKFIKDALKGDGDDVDGDDKDNDDDDDSSDESDDGVSSSNEEEEKSSEDEEEEEEEEEAPSSSEENKTSQTATTTTTISTAKTKIKIAASKAALASKMACVSVARLKLYLYGLVIVEAQVPLNQSPHEPLTVMYQNREYKIKLTPQMIPGSKVITKIYHIPLSEQDAASVQQHSNNNNNNKNTNEKQNSTNETNEESTSISFYRNIGVKRRTPEWHKIEPKVWSGDSRICEAHVCIAKELTWLERNLQHLLEDEFADENQTWNGELWRDRVRKFAENTNNSSKQKVKVLRDRFEELRDGILERCSAVVEPSHFFVPRTQDEKEFSIIGAYDSPWWTSFLSKSMTYSALALEVETFSRAVHSLRFMDRTTWFYSSLSKNSRWNDVFIPRPGQDLIYDRKRQIHAESEMSPEDRLVASELGANRQYWRGNNPVLCVTENVTYVRTGNVPMAVVSVRLVGNGNEYDAKKDMRAEIERHCKHEHRKPLARFLGDVIVSLREEMDSNAFERNPTEKQAPDYNSSLNLKKIERRVVNGRYTNIKDFHQDIVRIAIYFARYWIDIMEYEQLECVPRLLLSTTSLLLRQNADEEFLIEMYAGNEEDQRGEDEMKTGKRKCQRQGHFPYVKTRVCLVHKKSKFIRTGAVKGFYRPTNTAEPLWLVEFDCNENDNNKTETQVVNLSELHRGITVFLARELLISRRKFREERHAEFLRKKSSKSTSSSNDLVGQQGKSITVTGTSSRVTAHLDSLVNENSDLFDPAQYEVISSKGFQVQEENGEWRDCVLYRHEISKRVVLSFEDGTFEGLKGIPYRLEHSSGIVFNGDVKSGNKLFDSDGDLIPTRCTLMTMNTHITNPPRAKVFSSPVVENNQNAAQMETGKYRCEKCGKTYNHTSSLWYHMKYKICEKKGQDDSSEDAKLKDLVNDVVSFVNNNKNISKSQDEFCKILRDAALRSSILLRDEHIFTLLGEDALTIPLEELMKRLHNVLMVEGHSGFISVLQAEKKKGEQGMKTPIKKSKEEDAEEKEEEDSDEENDTKDLRKSRRAAAAKAKTKLKDSWKVIESKTTPLSSKKRKKRVEIEQRPKTILKFLISLDSSRQRFLYPAEMYFAEIHREHTNAASTDRQRAEKQLCEKEMKDMRQAELQTRMMNLYEQAKERFQKGWGTTTTTELTPLQVHPSLTNYVSLNRKVIARRVDRRSGTAQKLNQFERQRLREMRKDLKVKKQIERLLKTMVVRVEKQVTRELKSEKKKKLKLEKEQMKLKRMQEITKRRKMKDRITLFRKYIREELIFRKRCVQNIRTSRENDNHWPPLDSDGNAMPLPSLTRDDQGNTNMFWNENDDEETYKERLVIWDRYMWSKLATQNLPQRSKISAVLTIQGLLYRAEKIGIDVVTNPQCVMLRSQLKGRVDKLLNGFKKYKKIFRVRLKLGNKIVHHELDGRIPEYAKPGELVALERSRRNKAEESISSSAKSSKRLKTSHHKDNTNKNSNTKCCTCRCTNMMQSFVQCDQGDGWWCLKHAKLTAEQADTIDSWICPNCSGENKKKLKNTSVKRGRGRPTNASLGISELFEPPKNKRKIEIPVLSQEALVRCPRCKGNALTQGDESKTWLCCDRCDRWIHSECESSGKQIPTKETDQWFCDDCIMPCDDTAFYFDRERKGKRVKVYLKVDGVHVKKKTTMSS